MDKKNIQKLLVTVREIKLEKKQTFYAGTTKINDKRYKVKFTQDGGYEFKEAGLYYLTVEINGMCISVQKGSPVENKRGKIVMSYPTLWIKQCIACEKLTGEELASIEMEKLKEVFGE